MKPGSPHTVGEKLVKGLTNVCFSFFVLAVLILTVIAVTYRPPDPWTEPGKAIDQVLSSVKNATFRPDDSVLRTGEDFALTSNENATITALEPAITLGDALERQAAVPEKTVCDPQQETINCSDPRVLVAVVSYNLEHFPDLNFYAYQTPVKGVEESECDVSWRFRAQKEKSWRMYRDYRRFTMAVNDACKYSVAKAGDWHSGKNARRFKFGRRGRPFGGSLPMIVPSVALNSTAVEEVEVIDDSVPAQAGPENTFLHNRFLYYSRGGDHCKKMNQYLWSFLCALGEAHYLNRTLVVDLNLCLSSANNPGHVDEDGKDFRFYFDFAHLKVEASVIEQKEFLDEWHRWNQTHHGALIPVRELSGATTTPMELRGDKSTIIMRNFELQEPDNYWYRVCEGETEKAIQRPWHLLWKSKRIMDIVNAICGKMEWDFDAVHVIRGEKAKNKELWPKLDTDTSIDSLIAKLRDQIDTSRHVYIATNEMQPGYFDSFKDVYPQAYVLDDFRFLWDKGSDWYNQTLELTGGRPVELDGYMRVEIDTEVTYRAKKKVETFGFLTNDCKDGVNTC